MKTIFVLVTLTLTSVFSATQSASLVNVLYARYVCRSQPNGYKSLVPGSCNQYYECQHGRAQLRSCARYFDSSQGMCVVSNTGCVQQLKAAAFIPAGCSGPCCGVSSGYVLDPINAQVFYKCQNNWVQEELECFDDLVFNLVKLECDMAANCGGEDSATSLSSSPATSSKPVAANEIKVDQGAIVEDSDSYTQSVVGALSEVSAAYLPSSSAMASNAEVLNLSSPTSLEPVNLDLSQEDISPVAEPSSGATEPSAAASEALETSVFSNSGTTSNPVDSIPSTFSDSLVASVAPTTGLSNIDLYLRFVCRHRPDDYLLQSLTSCSEFYICHEGVAVVQHCGDHYFNAAKGICDLPQNTKCSWGQPKTSSETYLASDSATSLNSVAASTNDETDLISSSATPSKPATSNVANSAASSLVSSSDANETHLNNEAPTTVPKPLVAPSNELSNIDLYLRFVCRGRPDDYILQSLKSCSEYYICVDGIAVVQTCGDHYFNAAKGICDLPQNTICSFGPVQTGSETDLNEVSETTLPSSAATSADSAVTKMPSLDIESTETTTDSTNSVSENESFNLDLYLSLVCRGKPDDYRFFSLEKCNEYYVCRDGIALVQSCGVMYFNAASNICDLPENTQCVLEQDV